jgi:hypothetical protein
MFNRPSSTADEPPGGRPERSQARTVALIGGAATLLAAVISGVFLLASNHDNGGTPTVVTTILQPLGTGGPDAQNELPKGSAGGAFLADEKAIKDPGAADYATTIGGRSVVKALGLGSGGEAQYTIPSSAKTFAANVGLDDNGRYLDPDDVGTFSIFGDSTELGQVTLKRGQLAQINASVAGHKVLQLGYSSNNEFSQGVFGVARFVS